jgi:hypothetical protein
MLQGAMLTVVSRTLFDRLSAYFNRMRGLQRGTVKVCKCARKAGSLTKMTK